MTGDPSDEGDRHFPLRGMLPRPIPFRYRFLDAEERAGRGRLAVRLWLLGFAPRTAWAFAMAPAAGWREHLPDRYEGRFLDALLEGEFIRRRLWDVVLASDVYREAVEVSIEERMAGYGTCRGRP